MSEVTELIDRVKKLTPEQFDAFAHDFRVLEDAAMERSLESLRADIKAQGLTEDDVDRIIYEHRYGKAKAG